MSEMSQPDSARRSAPLRTHRPTPVVTALTAVVMIGTSLGTLGSDEIAVSLASTVLSPSVLGMLRWRGGLTSSTAAELVAELLVPWFERRTVSRPTPA